MSNRDRGREVMGAWNEILIRMMLDAMIEYGEALKELDNRLEKLEGKVNAPESFASGRKEDDILTGAGNEESI